jgi:hypothetical protein
VKKANVNIFDFVRVQQAGGDLSSIKFSSKKKLRQNTKKPGRRFPLEEAKKDELLAAMLIQLY